MTAEAILQLHERLGDEYISRCQCVGINQFPEICWSSSPDGRQTIAIVFLEQGDRVLRAPHAILPRLAVDVVLESRSAQN